MTFEIQRTLKCRFRIFEMSYDENDQMWKQSGERPKKKKKKKGFDSF